MAAESSWFYAKDGKQNGPVTRVELQGLLTSGQVLPSDLVWRDGMAKWTAAREVPELAGSMPAGAPAPAVSGKAPLQVGYYAPEMGMPSRAVKNLMGHARPRGDASTWPLDDEMIGQFQDALKIRKKVTNAAQLYHLLLFVATISAAVFILVTIFTFLIPGRGRHSPPLAILPASFFTIAFSVLYFFVERATRRSHRWAPLTMFIVFTASLVVQICTVGFSIMLQSSARPGTVVGMTVSFLILVLFSGGFALVSWGAFAAIPKYLQKPAWCQELIVKAGL